MRIPWAGIVIVCACGLPLSAGVGCGGPTFIVQQYAGEVRPAETIGIIRLRGTDAAVLDSLDGEPITARVPEDARMHIEVLPGRHRMGVVAVNGMLPLPQMVSFRAEAGKVYRPVLMRANSPSQGSYRADRAVARVYEIDAGSDALIRDVTLSDREETNAAAPRPGNAGKREKKPAENSAPKAEPAPPADATPAAPADATPAAPADAAPAAPAEPTPAQPPDAGPR